MKKMTTQRRFVFTVALSFAPLCVAAFNAHYSPLINRRQCYAYPTGAATSPYNPDNCAPSRRAGPFPATSTHLPSATPIDAELEPPEETPLRRMRRRKVAILHRRKTINVGYLFGLWYVLSIMYNIFSKRVLNMAPGLAWTAAWFQMALGALYVGPLWASGLRSTPELSPDDVARLIPVAALHSLVHVGGVVSMSAGAVSFTYIVKASEPAVSAALSAAVTKSFLPLPVYLTLIPVMAGVALSSVSELTFSWRSFNYAMMSNVASAARGIVGKRTMRRRVGRNMDAMNLYAVLTLLSSALLLPAALALEGPIFSGAVAELRRSGRCASYFVQTLLAALFYYSYNECAFLCLDNVSAVSHALGNTLKRVFVIFTSVLVFGNRMTPLGILGSAMAIGGVFLYSLAKTKFVPKKKT